MLDAAEYEKLSDFIMTARTDTGDDEILPGQGFSGSVDN